MTGATNHKIGLPPGFTARPATLEDVPAATRLFNACEIRQTGRAQTSEDDNRREWLAPSFHLETDTLAIFSPKGELVAYGEVWDRAPHSVVYTWARVHPDYETRGLGTALLGWCERRAARAVEAAPEGARIVIRQGVAGAETATQALLEAHGYTKVRQFYRMVVGLAEPPPAPRLPEGLSLITFDQHPDLAAVIRADQEAFADHWGFVLRPMEQELQEWEERIKADATFDPTLWFLAMAGDEIAGFCLCTPKTTEDSDMGWVSILGVRRPWRRQGLGLALLHHAFGILYERGRRRVALGVDAESLTGATRLYEKAGMRVERFSYTFEKELRAGEDLSTQDARQ